MKVVNGYDLMKYAKANGYLLPAFNTTNMEMTYAIAKGLGQAKMPGYIQISSSNLRLSNAKVIAEIAKDALSKYDTPVALHLDHGKSFDDVKACVDAGFTSIMFDASQLAYEDNILEVRKVVEYCHFYGIPVEAELGALKGKEDEMSNECEAKTNPETVYEYAIRTGCDMLAVSVGNVHGLEIKPNIDLQLLATISKKAPCPLVMHGGSGIPFDVINKAKKHNLIKINYGTDLRKEFIRTFGEKYMQDRSSNNVINLSLEAVENVSRRVRELVCAINERAVE